MRARSRLSRMSVVFSLMYYFLFRYCCCCFCFCSSLVGCVFFLSHSSACHRRYFFLFRLVWFGSLVGVRLSPFRSVEVFFLRSLALSLSHSPATIYFNVRVYSYYIVRYYYCCSVLVVRVFMCLPFLHSFILLCVHVALLLYTTTPPFIHRMCCMCISYIHSLAYSLTQSVSQVTHSFSFFSSFSRCSLRIVPCALCV